MLLRLFLLFGFLCTFCSSCDLELYWTNSTTLPFLYQKNSNISDRLANMTLEEKVGQLLLYKTSPSNTCNEDFLYQIVESGQFGTLILEDYTIEDYIRITANCNKLAPEPLWYATTENVSLNNQFSGAVPFPKAATIGAIRDPKIHKEIRDLYIDQCRALGIHLNVGFALSSPSKSMKGYDLNNFGQEKATLATHVNGKIYSLFKHCILSGGQLINDFSLENGSNDFLNDETLNTYRKLTGIGLAAVAVNKQNVIKSQFASFSKSLIKNYLHYGIGFDGFLFSTVNDINNIEQLLDQGTDILIVEDDIDLVFQTVLDYIKTGGWSEKKLNDKVEKILKAKLWTQKSQTQNRKLDANKINHLLQYPHFKTYTRSCYQKSVALIKNKNLPFKNVHQQKYQVLHFDDIHYSDLVARMQKYSSVEVSSVSTKQQSSLKKIAARLHSKPNPNQFSTILKKGYSKILVLDRDISQNNISLINTINNLAQKEDVTIINFGNPYQLQALNVSNIIHVFERNKDTEEFVAELLFGGQTANGKLTVDISTDLKIGSSIQTPTTRLNYGAPEMMGLDAEKLDGISDIVQKSIQKKAIPGCQVLIAKQGSIIYNKSFGHHTYEEKVPVQNDDLYDLASLTKTTATTLATMKLYEQNRLSLDDNMEHCFGDKCGKRLKKTKIENLLLHTSRLQANMPIYSFIHKNGVQKNECNTYFCGKKRRNYKTKIADHFYINDNIKADLIDDVLDLKLQKSKRYRYSDVNFNLLQQVIEDETKLSLDQYVYQNFYTPLHLKRCLYKPTSRYYKTKIVPTARDRNWRNQLLHGFVHDESAALLGGVGGNAGLFSNAEDLAVLYQMLLNGGSYGGVQFLKEETVDLFTKKQVGSRRGLGFDKPRKTKYPSYSQKASKDSYGHTGFTGTAVWVDPESELVYIFLSNRIHPKPNNTKLFKLKTRKKIHEVVYKAFDSIEVKLPSFNDKL